MGGSSKSETMKEKRLQVEKLLESGMRNKDIALTVGVPEGTANTWIRKYRLRNGIPTPPRTKREKLPGRKGKHLSKEELEQIKEMMLEGKSDREIAEKIVANSKAIWRWRHIWGIGCEPLPLFPNDEQGPNADRHLCRKCKYRAKDCKSVNKDTYRPGCDYYLTTGEERGSSAAKCEKFKKGASISAKKKKKEDAEMRKERAAKKALLLQATNGRPDIEKVLNAMKNNKIMK